MALTRAIHTAVLSGSAGWRGSRESHGTLQAVGRPRKQNGQAQNKKANTLGKGVASFGLPNISQAKQFIVDSIPQSVVLSWLRINSTAPTNAVLCHEVYILAVRTNMEVMNRNRGVIPLAYAVLPRQQLGYGVQFWYFFKKHWKDGESAEKMQ